MHRNSPMSASAVPCLLFVSMGMIGRACPMAAAADYEMVVSGPLLSATSDSSTFDGTNQGTPPPVLNLSGLEGGSFRAIFRFSPVTPEAGDSAFYELRPSSGMTF